MTQPRMELLNPNLFLSGPTEALVKACVSEIKKVPQWNTIFNDYIDGYERTDYPIRAFPALRIYNKTYRKEHESHYIYGDLLMDIIYPADIRRNETQDFQDTLAAALLQQFRRPTFFSVLCGLIPGLNELGKVFDVDKTLGMQWQDGILPLTEIKANFRIDLKVWDDYLESELRTKDDPFIRTLGDLEEIATTIRGVPGEEELPSEIELEIDQTV